MAKLFAVYQFGWRDGAAGTTPSGTGSPPPAWALIGPVPGTRGKADRIAARLRRAGRAALGLGTLPQEPMIRSAPYDPFRFVPLADRARLTRREAHSRAIAGVVARRGRGICRRRHGEGGRHRRRRVQSVHITPEVVDPDDVEMLEDLVLAAVSDGLRRSQEISSESLGGVTGGLDLGGLGDLGGLLG